MDTGTLACAMQSETSEVENVNTELGGTRKTPPVTRPSWRLQDTRWARGLRLRHCDLFKVSISFQRVSRQGSRDVVGSVHC